MSNYTDLLIRLEKAQRDYPDTHVLLGQTRTAIGQLQADVERYRKCLQRIVDEGWDRYGFAETLEPTEKDDG